jgi:mono/diheme cytochrome c family protein
MDQFRRKLPVVRTMLAVLAAAGLAQTGPARHANAQPVPNTAAAGKQLAQQYCVTCHVIVPSGQGGWTDAPPFDVIANRPGVTAAQLSTVAQKPHLNMLNDQRPKPEADAIATYIMSLRKH